MDGFFSKKETESLSRPDGRVYSCISCGLFKECKSPKMEPYGNFRKKIMIIGEAPGEQEDIEGKPWQGKTGRLLQRTLHQLGINLFEDCISLNSTNCRPTDTEGDNRNPVTFEIDNCRRIVLEAISKYKPKVILLLGNSAVYSLIGHRWKKDLGGITKWRGWAIPDQDYKAWICPTFHPSFIERSDSDDVSRVIWQQDLEFAISKAKEPFLVYKEPHIEVIEDLEVLNNIPKHTMVVPDFETTGKKPYAFGHEIVCCSIADSPDHTYVFMIPESRKARQPLVNLLTNPDIPKYGQNVKFEQDWAYKKFRIEITPWAWDTMLVSHILDNRPGITGLKFQTYVQFGIVDYSSEVDPYIKPPQTKEDGANSFNKILDLVNRPGGMSKLLTYCGYDTINEYRLALLQKERILEHCLPF